MRSPDSQMRETAVLPVWRRLRLLAEMALLYVAAPVLIYDLVYVERVPLFELLPWVFGVFAILLILERDWSWGRAFARFIRWQDFLKIALLFAICGGALTWYAQTYYPAGFLRFPRVAYDLWVQVMILYPVISVTTQEIIYRVFFFHRYAAALGNPYFAIVLNAALFAFAHGVLFGSRHTPFHWESVALSFAGGLLFAYRYHRTRSFWTVAFEHALYGNLIFTIGLGRFFFTGVSNF
jgi:membrane protease YdiL (CAAX protease family)